MYGDIRDVKSIVVHGGAAHQDDVLAVMLALQYCDAEAVSRREPRARELDDPQVLVLDVGQQYDPMLRNFDHHQRVDAVAGECAFSLLVSYLGLAGMFMVQRWYAAVVSRDVAGEFELATNLGLPRFPFELDSPIDSALLGLFEDARVIDRGSQLYGMLQLIGSAVLKGARRFASRYVELRDIVGSTSTGCIAIIGANAGGERSVLGWLVEEQLTGQDLYETLQWLHDHEQPHVGFVLYHSSRGEGWDVTRFNDHPSLDFSQLDGLEGVEFAHPGGFFAQINDANTWRETQPDIKYERCTWREALGIISAGLAKPKPVLLRP